jgi:membrane protease YdiL (CAAX protease family)
MTALAIPRSDLTRLTLLGVGLVGIVSARWSMVTATAADPIAVGVAFGTAMVALAIAGGWRRRVVTKRSILAGLVGGAMLVAIAALARASGSEAPLVRHPAAAFPLAPWAAATSLVALGEEAVLRGSLFEALEGRFGAGVAVAATSVAFALMHVPLYGWQVVPLDLGAGLWFAGLRLLSGGVAAPAIAHALADLATYWL